MPSPTINSACPFLPIRFGHCIRPIGTLMMAALVILSIRTGEANAQDTPAAQGARMAAAFNDWAVRWGISDTALVVMRNNRITGRVNRGSYTITKPVPVASMSKAITGACIAKLVDLGRFTYNARIGVLLRPYFNANPPADARVLNITVGQLLTHSSGITDDLTIGRIPSALNFRKINAEPLLSTVLATPLGGAPGTVFFYNNVNYVALGMIIDRYSGGLGYEEFCKRRVLRPLGITRASLNPPWRIMGAFGGWRISALDYAKFLEHFRARSGLIQKPIGHWPKWLMSNGDSYSIGVMLRDSPVYYDIWHNGHWEWSGAPYTASFGGDYFYLRNQVRFVVTYTPVISWNALLDLNQVMNDAAFP